MKLYKDISIISLLFISLIVLLFPETLISAISIFIFSGTLIFLSIINFSLGSNIKQYAKPLHLNKLGCTIYNFSYLFALLLIYPICSNVRKGGWDLFFIENLIYIALIIYAFSFIRIKKTSKGDL